MPDPTLDTGYLRLYSAVLVDAWCRLRSAASLRGVEAELAWIFGYRWDRSTARSSFWRRFPGSHIPRSTAPARGSRARGRSVRARKGGEDVMRC